MPEGRQTDAETSAEGTQRERSAVRKERAQREIVESEQVLTERVNAAKVACMIAGANAYACMTNESFRRDKDAEGKAD